MQASLSSGSRLDNDAPPALHGGLVDWARASLAAAQDIPPQPQRAPPQQPPQPAHPAQPAAAAAEGQPLVAIEAVPSKARPGQGNRADGRRAAQYLPGEAHQPVVADQEEVGQWPAAEAPQPAGQPPVQPQGQPQQGQPDSDQGTQRGSESEAEESEVASTLGRPWEFIEPPEQPGQPGQPQQPQLEQPGQPQQPAGPIRPKSPLPANAGIPGRINAFESWVYRAPVPAAGQPAQDVDIPVPAGTPPAAQPVQPPPPTPDSPVILDLS